VPWPCVSPLFFTAARRGAAFFVAVEAKTKISLPSPNGSVDQRKSPSWHARIGLLNQRRRRRSSPIKTMVRHASQEEKEVTVRRKPHGVRFALSLSCLRNMDRRQLSLKEYPRNK
jgi:hypothetical protein